MPISINNTTLTFNNGTTMTTAATGTVTSVATGNGLQGGTITTSGTLSVACPGFNTVGSYAFIYFPGDPSVWTLNGGNNYSAGSGGQQVRAAAWYFDSVSGAWQALSTVTLSGTWKYMGSNFNAIGGNSNNIMSVGCRVS